MKPLIICVDGVDGAGKNTQTQLLAKHFNGVVVSFPNYKSESGNIIEAYLKGDWSASTGNGYPYLEEPELLNAYLLQSLMTVNRLESVAVINGYLAKGQTVILDRYYSSALVYGQVDGLPIGWLKNIHQTLPEPDHWVLVDLPVEESFKRRPNRRDRYESNMQFLKTVRDKYLDLFKEGQRLAPDKWHMVNGLGTESEVFNRILRAIDENSTEDRLGSSGTGVLGSSESQTL